VNAAGLTHTSVVLRDALVAVERPFWEVHLSDPYAREPFRHLSYLEDIAEATIVGKRGRGYHEALEAIAARCGANG
jgi:3-dehydroquinate dehydratase-2